MLKLHASTPLVLAFLALNSVPLQAATVELTVPTDAVTAWYALGARPVSGGVIHDMPGNVNPSNPSEPPNRVIDNQVGQTGAYRSKYYQTSESVPGSDGNNLGVIIYPKDKIGVLDQIEFISANDMSSRTPATYTLEGTKDHGVTWQLIQSGSTGMTTALNASGGIISVNNQEYFSAYRVVFPTRLSSDASAGMQIDEINLFGSDSSIREAFTRTYRPTITVSNGFAAANTSGSETPANFFDGNTATKMYDVASRPRSYDIDVHMDSIVNGISFTTGNDNAAQGRNPTSFTLRGSKDGVTFTDIVTDIALPDYRLNFYEHRYTFENDEIYNIYQLYFPNLHSGGGLQLSEITLFGIVPEPSRFTLILASCSMALLWRRRTRSL